MTNFIQAGNVLAWTNTSGADVSSGDIVAIGSLVGIAVTDILQGNVGSVNLEGVYTVPSAGFVAAQGAIAHYDTVAKHLVSAVNSNTLYMGNHWLASLVGDTIHTIRLNSGTGALDS